MTLRVLSVASEAFPIVKTGGLGDVVGALPAALAPHGIGMTTLLPGYPAVVAARRGKTVRRWADLLGVEARLIQTRLGEHPLLVLVAPALYERPGPIYGHDDDWLRFAALCRAAADLADQFDVVHAHDWQAALVAAYLRFSDGDSSTKSLVTIHNIAFQGSFPATIFPQLGLPETAWSIDGAEYYGGVGLLKAGLSTADAITTVSPTYAAEIRESRYGMGLEGVIAARSGVVSGIVNGIDPAVWRPDSDPALTARYGVRSLARRSDNKRAVETAFALDRDDGPLFIVVSRLTWQKGMDVLAEALPHLVGNGARLALLGSGDRELEEAFTAAAARWPGRVAVRIGYDEPLSHLMQGGGDAILIPSRFEPCGLTQLYGLAYGCVPVVARTGGLADTVIDANDAALAAGVATGFQHADVSVETLRHAITRTIAAYAERGGWTAIQRNGMRADFSWRRSGQRYADLYNRLVTKR